MPSKLVGRTMLAAVASVCGWMAWNPTSENRQPEASANGLVIPVEFEVYVTATAEYVECRIPIHNAGGRAQKLAVKKMSCACVNAILSSEQLEPGQSGHILLRVVSPFAQNTDPQWLSDATRSAEIVLSASDGASAEAAKYTVNATLKVRSAVQLPDGHCIAASTLSLRRGEEILIPVSHASAVSIQGLVCDSPGLAEVIDAKFSDANDGTGTIVLKCVQGRYHGGFPTESHLTLKLESKGRGFVERIPLRFTQSNSVTVNPKAIVITKEHSDAHEHVLTFASADLIHSITQQHITEASNAGITVEHCASSHRCVIHIERVASGVLNQILDFKVTAEDDTGAITEENIRVPVIGRL